MQYNTTYVEQPYRVSMFTNSISSSVIVQWSVITLISNALTIRLLQSKTDPFHTRHNVHILATNTSACSVRASLQLKEVILPTVRNGPVIFNLTIFTIVADAYNKHSTLFTITNLSQFKAICPSFIILLTFYRHLQQCWQ